ncbi:MAG TPA: hypothetical protein VFS57_07510, partial [Gemmatimonadaceae bacterium]|nr:hypothetical protein [Gemmatimonadaceae bacterium]
MIREPEVRNRIGDSLIQAGLIGEHDLQRALDEHRRTGERLGTVLVRMNLATERQIANLLAAQLGFPYIQLSDHPPDPNAVTLISKEAAVAEGCIGLRLENGVLTVAMTDPL